MKNMKVEFKMDIKNPNRRTCYTKVTYIKSFNDVTFKRWLFKNFENVIKEHENEFKPDTVVRIDYYDLDNNNSYNFKIDFKNNLYAFYMVDKKIECASFTQLINELFELFDMENQYTEPFNSDDNEIECNDSTNSSECTNLHSFVMNSFNEQHKNDKEHVFETVKANIVEKIVNNNFIYAMELDPLVEYCYDVHDVPRLIVFDVSDLKLYKYDIANELRDFLKSEGFADILFNSDVTKLACIL